MDEESNPRVLSNSSEMEEKKKQINKCAIGTFSLVISMIKFVFEFIVCANEIS